MNPLFGRNRHDSNVLRYKPKRQGAILVLVVILFPVLLLVLGYSIDLAYTQLARAELRLAVDAAARAAAQEFSRTESKASAVTRAQMVTELNPVGGNPLTIQAGDISFGRSARNYDGTWSFTANGTPANALKLIGKRTAGSADGGLKYLTGWYNSRSQINLSASATAAFLNNDIMLVLDRSTSMKQSVTGVAGSSYDVRLCLAPMADSGWVALDSAVQLFLNEIDASPALEQIGIATFSSSLNPLTICGGSLFPASLDCPLTTDVAVERTAMMGLLTSVWNGNTNIGSGIDTARNELLFGFRARATADKYMLVLTDGNENQGNAVASATSAASSGIQISTVTFGPLANQALMKQVATIGGGSHYHAVNAADLKAIFANYAAQTALIIQ